MRVDESRHGDEAGAVQFTFSPVRPPDTGDAVAADGDVAPLHLPRDQIEDGDVSNHQRGGLPPLRLFDQLRQIVSLRSHDRFIPPENSKKVSPGYNITHPPPIQLATDLRNRRSATKK